MTAKEWLMLAYEDGSMAGWICLLVSAGLIVASFILPPLGVIDNTVLAAVGELIGWGVIFKLPAMVKTIKDGKSMTIRHGGTEVTIDSDKE